MPDPAAGRRHAPEGYRVLVCAPFGRDAETAADLLRAAGHDAIVCADLTVIAARIDDRVGAILLTEEALRGDLPALKTALDRQPSWADIPFVLLAATRRGQTPSAEASRLQLFDLATNSVVLERPLGRGSMVSAVASAVRSRRRQFEMRDRLVELAESEGRLRLATDAADIGIWDHDPVSGALRSDARCRAMFGLPADREMTMDDWGRRVHPDDRARVAAAVDEALRPGGSGLYTKEYRTNAATAGAERWIAAQGTAIFEGGRAVRLVGTTMNITESKRSAEVLDRLARTLEDKVAERTAALEEEMANRALAEAALRQSQKMEAVGQLTGGIAHDFNNMLTGVIGGLDIVKRRLASGRTDDLDRFMDAAAASAQRAAALTARLLAFSRRQSLDARPLDAGALAQSLEDLLRRTIGENIALRIVAAPGVPPAIADANQLENAILNLAINARDAMPDGGQLTVETATVELDAAYVAARPDVLPGRYVMVAVSDTGVGMASEVLDKVFDPFFTTKPIGQGTGLGLSMVYGFARQSGGQVRIHSRPGEGTSVKLYLPASDADIRAAAPAPALVREGRGETVLVVEDDPSVRLLVREVLAELNYSAIEAGDATAAIPILSSDAPIDLMVSDVGLPGLSGRQLAEIAREHRPALPILFVTGYAENAAIRAGFLGTNMGMITKPFAIDVLAAKIDEMIRAG
jgi:signal transduction histidine kinase